MYIFLIVLLLIIVIFLYSSLVVAKRVDEIDYSKFDKNE